MVTLRDIADQLRLSRPTVSYALGDQWRAKRIRLETRNLIRRKAEELGYRPNHVARSLKTRVTHSIGVLVPTISSNYMSIMLDGLESALGQEYTLLMGVSQWDPSREQRLLHSFEERMVDGVIVVSAGHRETLAPLLNLHKRGTPIVQIENSFAELHTDVVSPDNDSFGFQMTQEMIGLGHRKIYYLRSPRVHHGTLTRAQGYERAMREANLVPHCLPALPLYHEGSRFEFNLDQVRQLLRAEKPPLGIVANDFAGMLAALQATEEAGYQCPRDVSISGAGVALDGDGPEGLPLTRFLRMRFTVLDWSIEEMGRVAGRLILKRLNAKKQARKPEHILISGRFIVGESTAGPRSVAGEVGSH